jgi:hypothetical protein
MGHHKTPARRLLAAAALGAAALSLAACNSTSGTATSTSTSTTAASSPTTQAEDETTQAEDSEQTTARSRSTTTAASEEEPQETSALELNVGDCLPEELSGDSISTVDVVPCEQEHYQEVFHTEDLDHASFPGSETVDTEAEELCSAAFEDFVGVPYNDSELYLNYLTPTEGSWELGDREVVCLIYDPEGNTTGSLENAGR